MSSTDYETLLQETIFPDLEIGRSNWDKPHTETVVGYVKAIVDNTPELNVDRVVLVIAAYAHDWGYSGLFKHGKPLQLDEVNNAKEMHMKIGADKLQELLKDKAFDFLSESQKMTAIHLVKVHDNLGVLKDSSELVLMEADTLGGLDIERVTPAFDKPSNDKYMRGVKNKRYPMFITDYGKRQFERLYKLREAYYIDHQ